MLLNDDEPPTDQVFQFSRLKRFKLVTLSSSYTQYSSLSLSLSLSLSHTHTHTHTHTHNLAGVSNPDYYTKL